MISQSESFGTQRNQLTIRWSEKHSHNLIKIEAKLLERPYAYTVHLSNYLNNLLADKNILKCLIKKLKKGWHQIFTL
jgi:hypothetical protein